MSGTPINENDELLIDRAVAAALGDDDADADADVDSTKPLVEALERTAALTATLAPPQALPQHLRERLLAVVDASFAAAATSGTAAPLVDDSVSSRGLVDARAKRTPVVKPVSVRLPARTASLAGWAVAAVCASVAALGWWQKTAPDIAAPVATAPEPPRHASGRRILLARAGTVSTPLLATVDEAAAGAAGDVVWHSGTQRGYLRITGLRPNVPTREQYQLWIFDGDRDERYPVDGGVFDVGSFDEDGAAIIPIRAAINVARPTLFAVTVEKPGGVVVSARERIVLTATPG